MERKSNIENVVQNVVRKERKSTEQAEQIEDRE